MQTCDIHMLHSTVSWQVPTSLAMSQRDISGCGAVRSGRLQQGWTAPAPGVQYTELARHQGLPEGC